MDSAKTLTETKSGRGQARGALCRGLRGRSRWCDAGRALVFTLSPVRGAPARDQVPG
jgi:hypothetical protein